jgi:hypothetical protein
MADTLIAGHLIPLGGTGRCHAKLAEIDFRGQARRWTAGEKSQVHQAKYPLR